MNQKDNLSLEMPSWLLLNSQVIRADGSIDIEKDKAAAKEYFLKEINTKTMFFHSLKEKLDYLVENDYYEEEFLRNYSYEQIKEVFNIAYAKKFRFPTYMSAFKFYNDYALRTNDGKIYLERYEDRLSIVALYHADGDFEQAKNLIHLLINQTFTPATPTLLNTGRKRRGEYVSCFLISVGDSLNDISRAQEFAMQLSKRGGGVALNLTNVRAHGEPVKDIEGVSKGVVGVMKLLDNAFRYANQLGQRNGSGATYLNIFHPDFEEFLSTKKINADDDIRVKTLSIGAVLPDKFVQLAKEDKDMYQFYPHSVYKAYGVNFEDVCADMDNWYEKLVDNPAVKKRRVNPRKLLELIAITQGESGYPYIMWQDNVNNANPLADKIHFSNLCTEILQPSSVSKFADYGEQELDQIGMGISCNLASGHMENMIEKNLIKETVRAASDIMLSVSEKTALTLVPEVYKGNELNRSIGFGIMGHHGYIASKYIAFGSKADNDLIDVFFNMINFYSLQHSMEKSKETGKVFYRFEESDYADGSYFDGRGAIYPQTKEIKEMFKDIHIPTDEEWAQLKEDVMKYGVYSSYRLAIAPTGSISYIMSATASLTPIKQLVEERTYGNSRTFYPMPHAAEAGFMYETTYDIDNYKLINTIAIAQKHIDQGISFELGINSNITTKELQKYYLYAHHKGIKTLYYTRTRKLSVEECIACAV